MDNPRKYRKKPVVIEAILFTPENIEAVRRFMGALGDPSEWTPIVGTSGVYIQTLEGTMRADAGDWIIKGVKGEFYPCKPEIFEASYEPAE